VDYVRQVFDHFDDKRILVLGGKMGELTLKHLRPQTAANLVTNRSPEKAQAVASGCGGEPVAWDELDDVLARVDIVLSTTGAPEPIVTLERFRKVSARRTRGGPLVILDIAVPRDFDPRIHDGETTCLFNIDDLERIKEATLAERRKEVAPAEAIVAEETQKFLKSWARRRHGPVIARLTQDLEAKLPGDRGATVRQTEWQADGGRPGVHREGVQPVANSVPARPDRRLDGGDARAPAGGGHTLLDALRKLFRLRLVIGHT
jgi:glutamyl-tRNA reductase